MYRPSRAIAIAASTTGRWPKRVRAIDSQCMPATDQPKPKAQPSRVARRTELPMPTW
jgi:hypothetical protein